MKRRDILQLTAAVTAAPTVAGAQDQARGAGMAAKPVEWKPLVFDPHQNQTVVALTDLIIPANDTYDTDRAWFLAGLSWLDGYAIGKHGHPFVGRATGQQTTMLEAMETNKEPGIEPGSRYFGAVKSYTARIYYSTSAGYQELNKGGRVPSGFGCKHPQYG